MTSKPEEFLELKYEVDNVIFTNNDNIHHSILNYREKYLKMFPFLISDFKIFFIGGKKVYEQFIPLCEKVWVTQLKKDYDCDLFMNTYYSKEPSIIEEDDELQIILYEKTT